MTASELALIPPQASPQDLERDVARTADLVLKLSALVERYESTADSAERVAAMREVMRRGRRQLAALAGVDVAGLEPATSRV